MKVRKMYMGKIITKEEFDRIKLMGSLKTSVIAQLTGRGQSTIDRIKQANDWDDYKAIKVTAHKAPQTQKEPSKQTEMPLHMLDDNFLLRIADSIDYNNALMNGVVAKLDVLIKALGV